MFVLVNSFATFGEHFQLAGGKNSNSPLNIDEQDCYFLLFVPEHI